MADGRVDNPSAGSECVLMKPVSATFVDSPTAYEEARECWVVWSDPATGRFVTRLSGYGRTEPLR